MIYDIRYLIDSVIYLTLNLAHTAKPGKLGKLGETGRNCAKTGRNWAESERGEETSCDRDDISGSCHLGIVKSVEI